MSEQISAVTPDQTYYFRQDKTLRPSDIPDAVYEMTQQYDCRYRHDRIGHFTRDTETVRLPIKCGGAPYGVVGDEDSSRETAFVATLPYCNPTVPDKYATSLVARDVERKNKKAFDSNTWNNAEKHVFLFNVMKALGIRDEAGRTIPVFFIGADSQDYTPRLDRKQKKALRKGSLDVYADNAQEILEYEGFGQIYLGGYSQGGSVAHRTLARATNLDIAGATLAEMPTYKDRSIVELMYNYLLNKPAPKNESDIPSEEKWTESGPLSRRELEAIQNKSFTTMFQTIVLRGAWRTAFALTRGTMVPDLRKALGERGTFPLSVAWNGTSSLTHDIEQKLFTPDAPGREVLDMFGQANRLRTVKALGHEAVGAPYLAGESPMYYALLFAQSVQWAQQVTKSQ